MTSSPDTRSELAPTRPPLSYPRALAVTAALVGVSWWVGLGDTMGIAPTIAALAFAVVAWRRGVLRSQALVMSEVTWLVLAVILKLAFLESMPAAPLPVLLGVLLVQFLAQLLVDLKPFAAPGEVTPPVTYAVCFALVPAVCVAAAMFRVARADYAPLLGIPLSMGLAASFFLSAALWWDWTKKSFSSLKMAVTLLSLIGLGSVVGTVVIQRAPEESVQAHYEKFMNGEGAAPVNARYLFQDPQIEWTAADDARRVAMNEKFGTGQGDRWSKLIRHDRVKKAKEEEGRRWVASNRSSLHAFYELCESAELTRIFKSWYFNALLVLLAFTVVGVMVRRFPYEPRDAGWVTAHSGIVFLLACFAGSNLTVRDGFVELAPTASARTSRVPTETRSFVDIYKPDGARDFPWTLRLVRTSADWYQSLAVAFVDDEDRVVAQQDYPVLEGKAIELDRPARDAAPRYRIEIVKAFDRTRPRFAGYRSVAGGGMTALQLFVAEDGKTSDHWIADDAPLAIPGGQLRFLDAKTDAQAEIASTRAVPPDAGAIGFVRILAGDAEIARAPATTGANFSFQHGGKSWRLVVGETALDEQTLADESSKPAAARTPLERQYPKAPVAFVSVDADGVSAQRMAARKEGARAADDPASDDVLEREGLQFVLDFLAPREVRLVARPDGSLVLVEETRGDVVSPRVLHEHDPLPLLTADGPAVSVGALVHDAEEAIEVEPLTAESDADYMGDGLRGVNEQEGFPAILVHVSEPDRPAYDKWLIGGDPWGRPTVAVSRDRRLRLALVATSESMYRSAVQAVDSKGGVLGEHVIRVNTPFRMDGYEFYQNNFVRPDQGGPSSTFRVKYDPFVPWIYVGFVLVAGGVIALLWFPGQRAFKLHAHLARLPEEGPVT